MTKRGHILRPMAAATTILALTVGLTACGDDDSSTASAARAEPTAGAWQTWVLMSPLDVEVPAPPSDPSEGVAEVKKLAGERTPAVTESVRRFGGALPTAPWTAKEVELVKGGAKNPPLSSRNYGLLHAAMYDATVATWYWKYVYNVPAPTGVSTLERPGPDPSYPSEHAAIAGVASRVLAYLYPKEPAERLDEMADQAAFSRLQAGTNTRADIEAGLALGRAVADKVIAYAKADGADKVWDGRRPAGIGSGPAFWEPPPGSDSPPISPLAGTWKTWVMTSGSQFRPGPPPAYGTPEFIAEAKKLVEIRNNVTEEDKKIIEFYEGREGTALPAGITLNVAAEDVLKAAGGELEGARLTTPRSARAMAMVGVALADAGVAAWDTKFTYWNPRPENAIRDSGIDPNFKPVIETPKFPAYQSGSSTYAGAVQSVMTYLFPDRAEEIAKRAHDQARSRVLAGIHWEYDEIGLPIGSKIGDLVVARAKIDGADA